MWIECDAETLRGGREDEQARQSVVIDNVGVLEDISDRMSGLHRKIMIERKISRPFQI
jgi:hypothetical protein